MHRSLRAVKICLLVYRGTVVRLLVCVKRVNFGAHKPPVQRVLRLLSGQHESRYSQLCQLCRLYFILDKVSGIATADAQRTNLCVQTQCGQNADTVQTHIHFSSQIAPFVQLCPLTAKYSHAKMFAPRFHF